MIHKREDGLGRVFWPFELPALVLAWLSTGWSGAEGWLRLPVALGFWVSWSVTLFAAYILVAFLVSLTVDMKAPPPTEDHPHCRRHVVYIIGILCRLGRLRLHVEGLERMPQGRFLLVSNHRSNYDPIATVWAMRRWDMSFITKPENLKIPLAGPLIYRCGYLPINRENPREAIVTINQAASLLEQDVVSVGVYPEGTRNREGEMLPFHNGVFKIAQKANVPVVVLSVEGTEKISGHMPWHHTDVTLKVCRVISAQEAKAMSSAQLSALAREELEQQLGHRTDTTVVI
jgi:1-acyl-sn-glycerol-3-phosphate acyltransferase